MLKVDLETTKRIIKYKLTEEFKNVDEVSKYIHIIANPDEVKCDKEGKIFPKIKSHKDEEIQACRIYKDMMSLFVEFIALFT